MLARSIGDHMKIKEEAALRGLFDNGKQAMARWKFHPCFLLKLALERSRNRLAAFHFAARQIPSARLSFLDK